MSIEYSYDEQAALNADKAANALTEPGGYVGVFKKASAIVSQGGTHGIEFEFEAPGSGATSFSLYTKKEDGTAVFGMNYVAAMLFLFGLKGLKSAPGKVERYDEDARARLEVEGDVFPDLVNKPIGVVFQKELYSKQNGSDGARLSLIGVYQPETKLMVSEIREHKTKPVKVERLLKGLKVRDQRKKQVDVAQPALGGVDVGDF